MSRMVGVPLSIASRKRSSLSLSPSNVTVRVLSLIAAFSPGAALYPVRLHVNGSAPAADAPSTSARQATLTNGILIAPSKSRIPNPESRIPSHRLEVVVVGAFVKRIGWTNAPLVATSHAAKRTHFLPEALNGTVNFFLPNGARSVVEMIWRSVVFPSPHTTSTKLSG